MIDPVSILKNLSEPVIVTDRKGTILFHNNAASAFERYGIGKLGHGRHILDVCLPEYREDTAQIIEYIDQFHEPRILETIMHEPEGDRVYHEFSFTPVFNTKSTEDVVCITGKDITDQKIFERKANEIAHTLAELTENANAVIFSLDAQDYITSWNIECSRLTGFKRQEILAKPFRYFIKDEYLDNMKKLHQEVISGKAIRRFEVEMLTLDGRSITLLLSATPKRSREGKVVGILFVGQDITELSEYREGLEKKVEDRTRMLKEALRKEKQLVEIKKRFVSIASHEFRMPLGAIHSTVRKLESNVHLNPEEREKLKGIDTQVNHMRSLLDDVLTLEKTGVPQLTPVTAPVDLIGTLDAIIEEVSSATNHTHGVIRDYSNASVVVQADKNLLRNIFLNLISNAIKFSPGKKNIFVQVVECAATVTVMVKDEGIGIPPEDRDRVFEAFNRGTNTGAIPGTGLGLSIVRRAAEALSARVELFSEAGAGSTFYIHFPV